MGGHHCFSHLLTYSTAENPYKIEGEQITQRAKVLQKYLTDEQKELQALYALQALMVKMEQPASKWRGVGLGWHWESGA